MTLGTYRGTVAEAYRGPGVFDQLAHVESLLTRAGGQTLEDGRNRVVRTTMNHDGDDEAIVIKAFGPQSFMKDARDYGRGSKAHRTWRAARYLLDRGIGTPAPVAFLERWTGRRLRESYFISAYEDRLVSFRDELIHIYREEPDCGRLIQLLDFVAVGIRRMHDAGFAHRDLGNQNIMMRRDPDCGWKDLMFVDLNRGRIRGSLSLAQRAFDISRIALPSDFLRVFIEMYWQEVPPPAFLNKERAYRKRFHLHTATRRFRHPIRTWRRRSRPSRSEDYPKPRDIWIWDEKSAQAMVTMESRERKQYYRRADQIRMVTATLFALPVIHRDYRRLAAKAFEEPVLVQHRIGMAIDPQPDQEEKEISLLAELGPIPVMIRFYHHKGRTDWDRRIALCKRLHRAGHNVSIALIQDREAVMRPQTWKQFATHVVTSLREIVDLIEVGHAFNRVKWGIWGSGEHRNLMNVAATLQAEYPDLQFSGPASIDFEYNYTVDALDYMPKGLHFAALSHHLYVDRRGAPENRQGQFGCVEKFALARAVARWARQCENRVVISEVNWPLEGTGVWSPVGSPYVSPGLRTNDPSVSESDYARYMLRYIVLAVCSGFVDRVYWWRLVAHGFGLVDDMGEDWRKREAFEVLRHFQGRLGKSTFLKRLDSPEGSYALLFEDGDVRTVMAWSHAGESPYNPEFSFTSVRDMKGEPVQGENAGHVLDGCPIYYQQVQMDAEVL